MLQVMSGVRIKTGIYNLNRHHNTQLYRLYLVKVILTIYDDYCILNGLSILSVNRLYFLR